MKGLITILGFAIGISTLPVSADLMDELMEKARNQGGEYEKARRILNEEPDQNVRLAAFNLMLQQEDRTLKEIAIDAGINSTDRILQAQAFKAAVMDLEKIHLELTDIDSAAAKKNTSLSSYLEGNGPAFTITIGERNWDEGTFQTGHHLGETSGLRLNYTNRQYYVDTVLELVDDDTIKGKFRMYGQTMTATGKLR